MQREHGEPVDERAVEVEERADGRAVGTAVDLLDERVDQTAVEEGIVPGGGVALHPCREGARQPEARRRSESGSGNHPQVDRRAAALDSDQRRTGRLDRRPEGEGRKGDDGYNAGTDKYENLVAAGVIDPVKVVRTALQNASSIASLLLTTEALVSEIPEDKKESAGGPGGPGGMGGMLLMSNVQ